MSDARTAVELAPDLLRRVLVVMAFDNCDSLFWSENERVLSMNAICSDFFAWGCADAEPVETEQDVRLLEQSASDLAAADGRQSMWISYLYAARRRNLRPAPMMFGDGKYAMPKPVQALFDVLPVEAGGDR